MGGDSGGLAIEGYASDQLMGGVVLGWMAPEAAYFDGKLRLYLPIIVRDR